MKRQQSLADFFNKKPKLESIVSELALDGTKRSQAQPQPLQPEESSTSIIEVKNDNSKIKEIQQASPKKKMKEIFSSENIVALKRIKRQQNLTDFFNKKPKFESVVSELVLDGTKQSQAQPLQPEESITSIIEVNDNSKIKEIQQASPRKKMKEHFSSEAHNICKQNLKQCEQESMTKGKMNGKYLCTSKVFNTVYSLAKKCKSFSDIQKEIEVQIKNGLDMGIGLQSRKTVVKIVDFIAKAIKKEIFTKIVENNLNISLIIDKVSTISSKPVIIVFLKVEDSVTSPTIFVELIELEKQDADTICSAVMESLNNVGLAKNYLEKNLIGFCSDGTCGLLGIKSGVTTRIEKEFPNIIIWHGLNHRLHLGLDDLMKEIKLVNNFKIFIDKIHTIFHQSNKDQIEPTKISEQLGVELIKIGRVLEPWAACTLRSILAVWHAFPVLEDYFYSNEKYLGMS
ncbi:E3 SUMO-protein ligase KIAA1586-like [Thamnophis elegans]|uniref:E3 SUMO-protein ligase KIAA1586-like n=1 Tax=Thamnophis elegans TaxID=35005 RepID=UPI0013776F1E|nr:E3 SUMO-protein ligase KIAA1586-like [Thamnophis elegans]